MYFYSRDVDDRLTNNAEQKIVFHSDVLSALKSFDEWYRVESEKHDINYVQ